MEVETNTLRILEVKPTILKNLIYDYNTSNSREDLDGSHTQIPTTYLQPRLQNGNEGRQ